MSDADKAYEAAEAAIEKAREAGAKILDLAHEKYAALEQLPENLASLSDLEELILGRGLDHVRVADLTLLFRLPNLCSLQYDGCEAEQLADLIGLVGLTGLTRLDFDDTRFSDLSRLQVLTGLQELSLNNSPAVDLSPLQGLTGLQTLRLNNSPAVDLSPLQGLTGLQTLWLDNSQATDLSPLQGLAGLRTLTLNNSQAVDLSPLQGLSRLQTLYLDNSPATDLSPLQGLTGLQTLILDNSQAVDLRPLRALRKLAEEPLGYGLTFRNSAAARADPRIAEIAKIGDNKKRAAALFDYLEDWTPPEGEVGPAADGGEGGAPDLPAKAPAPMETAIRGGRLVRAVLERPHAPDDPAGDRARQGWDALRDFRESLGQSFNIGNYAPLPAILTSFDRALGASYDEMRQIGVGMHGARIVALSEDGEFLDTLPTGGATELQAFAVAVATFVNRFPDWVAYRDEAERSPPAAEAVAAEREAFEALGGVLSGSDRVDAEVSDEYRAELDAVKEQPESEIEAKGLLASTRDVALTASEAVMAEVKSGRVPKGFVARAKKTGETELPKIVYYAGPGLAADLLNRSSPALRRLAVRFPASMGWVTKVLDYLGCD